MKIAPFMARLGEIVKERIAQAVDGLRIELKAIQAQLDAVPDAVRREAASAAEAAVKTLPPAPAGKSVTIDDVRPVIADAIAAIEVPKGAPGKDADPALIKEMVDAAVADAVSALPPPEKGDPGESVPLDTVKDLVAGAVAEAMSALRVPADGKSVTVEDVEPLLRSMVAALPPPPKGDKGDPGDDVHPDTVRLMVQEAVSKAVADIPPAKDGDPGRDAAELVILPAIDIAKEYPRGTWAKHAGGLVRALRNTDVLTGPLEAAGWEVVVDGLKAVQVERSGERGFRLVAELTSGEKSEMDCALPVLLDRGRYDFEKGYEPGDVVDWSGSMWIAQMPSKNIEPRTGIPEWRLAVRRGRDGKDAVVRTVEPPKPIKV